MVAASPAALSGPQWDAEGRRGTCVGTVSGVRVMCPLQVRVP